MKKRYIERKPPRYSVIAYLLHYAYHNDYPKNKEKFVWGIPSKYANAKDREVSAIVTSYLYDGTRRSIKAINEVDAMFKGSPFGWLASNRHCDMMMEQNQEKQIYGRMTITDLYMFFRELRVLYSQYGSIYKRFKAASFDTLQENMNATFSVLSAFNGKDIVGQNRRNLFFFMMAHCFNDYKVDESQLIVPLYESIMKLCIGNTLLPPKSKMTKETAVTLTDNLRWFSENHPLTFWVGILGYMEAVREKDKMIGKLPKMKLTRHKFNKR